MGLQKNTLYGQNGDPELARSFEAKLTMARVFLPMASLTMLTEKIADYTYDHWDQIYAKNEAVIWTVAKEFPGLDKQIKNIYSYRLNNGQLLITDVDKAKTWVNIHGLIRMCIKGIMICREKDPACCSYVDLAAARRKWGVADAN